MVWASPQTKNNQVGLKKKKNFLSSRDPATPPLLRQVPVQPLQGRDRPRPRPPVLQEEAVAGARLWLLAGTRQHYKKNIGFLMLKCRSKHFFEEKGKSSHQQLFESLL